MIAISADKRSPHRWPVIALPPGPLVSVIIPAYNAERTLAETLASVAAQTYAAIEILIVDDGSTDTTAAIAQAFCASDARARLIRQPNSGVAMARNAAIAQCAGAFVAPIDADDLWHPDYLSLLVAKAMTTRPTPGFVYAWHRRIDEAGDIIHSGPADSAEGSALQRMGFRNLVGNGSASLISRAALAEAGGYDPRLRAEGAEGTEDVLLLLAIAARHPIASVPAFLVGYRSRPGSLSEDGARMFESKRRALRIYAERFPDRPLLKRSGRWIRARRALILAYQSCKRRRFGTALRTFVTAILLDPRATFAIIQDYRARPPKPFAEAAPRINFLAADPAVAIIGYNSGAPRPASLLLEERRLRSLALRETR
ncbi:MAG TPA: glycosyltransferase family 2 protein [Sphingomonas sp.]